MQILVCVASRYGATDDIAREISSCLRRSLATDDDFVTVDLLHVQQVGSLENYDAVIVGSAVYMGRWIRSAHDFIQTRRKELGTRPVWLFSSGPLGDPPQPISPPADLDELMRLTKARGHQSFDGRLNKQLLTSGERAIVRMVGAPEGDFRDWAKIDAWASHIAHTLERELRAAEIARPQPRNMTRIRPKHATRRTQ